MDGRRPRIGIRCDVGQSIGVGHLMRCAALAEEMIQRGWHVEFCTNADSVSIAKARLTELGCEWRPALDTPAEHIVWATRSSLDATVFDSYILGSTVSLELSRMMPTLAFIDGHARGQSAHIYVDQNYGAERMPWNPADSAGRCRERLAGSEYAVLADRFLRLRAASARRSKARHDALSVVVLLGGTDSKGLGQTVIDGISRCEVPLNVSVFGGRCGGSTGNQLDRNPQAIRHIAPTLDLGRLLVNADLVVSAAGSSLWELCLLGKPVAALAVALNQVPAYGRLVADGVVFGLGDASSKRLNPARVAHGLETVLIDRNLRELLADRAYRVVDGGGKVRVVDALKRAMDSHPA